MIYSGKLPEEPCIHCRHKKSCKMECNKLTEYHRVVSALKPVDIKGAYILDTTNLM